MSSSSPGPLPDATRSAIAAAIAALLVALTALLVWLSGPSTPVSPSSSGSPSASSSSASSSPSPPSPSSTSSASPTPSPSSSSTPSPSTSSNAGAWPGAGNTGVNAGIALVTYTGSLTISKCGVTISGALITGDLVVTASNGTHSPATPCVTITNSKVVGTVSVYEPSNGQLDGPLVMLDDEVAAPNNTGQSTVLGQNFYLWRLNVHGGARGAIQSDGYTEIHDSWVHDFYLAGASHYDGIGSNGTGGHPLLIDHNSIACTFAGQAAGATGGCSANVGLFGDFSPISNVTITNNLFLASPEASYALYANASAPGKAYPTGDHVVVTGNVFQKGSTGKCAFYGPVTGWGSGPGDVWSGNSFDDGTVITP